VTIIRGKKTAKILNVEKSKKEHKAFAKKKYERELLLSKDVNIPAQESLNYEKNLQKVATKGVVKLFNRLLYAKREVKRQAAQFDIALEKQDIDAEHVKAFIDLV